MISPSYTAVPLSDGGWYEGTLFIQTDSLQMTLVGAMCNPPCIVTVNSPGELSPVITGTLIFGNIVPVLNMSQTLLSYFPNTNGINGCIRNLVLYEGGSVTTLDGGIIESYPVQPGCPRDDHCSPNLCQNEGLCVSSWDGYICQCGIDYTGYNCSEGNSTLLRNYC